MMPPRLPNRHCLPTTFLRASAVHCRCRRRCRCCRPPPSQFRLPSPSPSCRPSPLRPSHCRRAVHRCCHRTVHRRHCQFCRHAFHHRCAVHRCFRHAVHRRRCCCNPVAPSIAIDVAPSIAIAPSITVAPSIAIAVVAVTSPSCRPSLSLPSSRHLLLSRRPLPWPTSGGQQPLLQLLHLLLPFHTASLS